MISSDSVEPANRPCLAQATELLIECFGVSAAQADCLIATWAGDCRTTPSTVAQVLIHQVWQGDGSYADTAMARTLENALRNLPETVAVGMDSDDDPALSRCTSG